MKSGGEKCVHASLGATHPSRLQADQAVMSEPPVLLRRGFLGMAVVEAQEVFNAHSIQKSFYFSYRKTKGSLLHNKIKKIELS